MAVTLVQNNMTKNRGKNGTTILVVDDRRNNRELVCYKLEKEGFQTLEAGSKDEAISLFEKHHPDLVVLDIMMPSGEEGYDVMRAIRKQSEVPVIFFTSKPGKIERIKGLTLGGDGFVQLEEGDFNFESGGEIVLSKENLTLEELVVQIRAVLKWLDRTDDSAKEKPDTSEVLEYFDIRLDQAQYAAYLGEKEVSLTKTLFNILWTLMQDPNKVHTYDELIVGAYGKPKVVDNKLISGHVNKARKSFERAGRDPIRPVPGRGYRLVPPDSASDD